MGLPLREFVCLCALVFGAIGSVTGLNWTLNQYDSFVTLGTYGVPISGAYDRTEANMDSMIACWDFEMTFCRPAPPAATETATTRETVAAGKSLPAPDLL